MSTRDELTGNQVYVVVRKLLGRIEPVGESNHDAVCRANLEQYENCIYALLGDITELVEFRHRQEASMKDIGDKALVTCKILKAVLEDAIDEDN